MATQILHGRDLLKILHEAGVIGDKVRRCVIDIPHDGAVRIFIEEFGGSELLSERLARSLIDAQLRKME